MGRFRPDHYPHYRIGSWIGGGPWSTDLPATNGYPRTMLFFADGSVTVVEMGVFGGSSVLGGTNRLHRGVERILTTPSFTSAGYTHTYNAACIAPNSACLDPDVLNS